MADYPSRDFEMMLARIIHRHRRGLDIGAAIEQAADLLRRKGSLSIWRDTTDQPQAPKTRRVLVPDVCPRCEAADLALCLDCGHCPANSIGNLTEEDIGWALHGLEQMEAQADAG